MSKGENTVVSVTMEQAQQEMEYFKRVYKVVRLLEKNEIGQIREGLLDPERCPGCPCYKFWNKDHPCENCISAAALEEKTKKYKLEFQGTDIYQVTARYLEIDGKPYVMELVQPLEEENMLDEEGREKLIDKLAGFKDKLYKDAQTGVLNRRYFEEKLKKRIRNAGVAMIDMDDFKLYNDTYGHDTGDLALEKMVTQIRKCIRKTDMLIRYGGDEFLLVMPDVTKEIFDKKLRQIKYKIQEARIPGCANIQLTVSIGGVLAEGEPMESAVRRADKLMYRAKNRKDTVVTESSGDLGSEQYDQEKMKQMLLVVDDSELNREILREMLRDDFRVLEVCNGRECVQMLEQYGMGISLVLLDIVMPEMDGFEVLGQMNRNHWIEDIPVIMISSEDSENYIRQAYELGVSDYISRPFDAKVVYQRVFNTIKLYAKQRRLMSLVSDQLYEKEKNNHIMVSILSQIVEFRNGESGLHVRHINILTGLLLERLCSKTNRYQLSWAQQDMIALASALHDIGKIGIDEKLLNKPGKLTQEEFETMKTHTLIGASMLENLGIFQNEPLVKVAYQICRWHHERYDGKGYPDGLKGEAIPIAAQVVALADVYDALVSERVYKKAFPHEKAIEMIMNGECGAFNPLLLECLSDIQNRMKHELMSDGGADTYHFFTVEPASYRAETDHVGEQIYYGKEAMGGIK